MANIKDFVAYEFEDVSDGALANGKFIWAPVLFPYHPDRNLYFVTFSVRGITTFNPELRKDLRNIRSDSNEFVINSIYDVCGYNPLFLIVEAKSPSNIKSAIEEYRHISPRYMSIATPADILKRFGVNKNDFPKIEDEIKDKPDLLKELEKGINDIIGRRFTKKEVETKFENVLEPEWKKFIRFVPMNMDKVISIILIQPPDEKTDDEIIKEIEKDERIIDAYKVMGESRLLIKIITEDIYEVFSYVEFLMRLKTNTISRIVLRTAKENGVPFGVRTAKEKDVSFKMPKLKGSFSEDKKEAAMQKDILRYLWKDPSALVHNREQQIRSFQMTYPKYFEEDDARLKKEFEDVENQFIYKYSTKLERDGWLRALLFIKYSLGGRKIIWDSIRDNLLGVNSTFFSRKFYNITGDFDYIVPIDFYNLHLLKEKIRKFLNTEIVDGNGEKVERYVNDIRAYFEEHPGITPEPEVLEPSIVAGIKAMMPNSRRGEKEGEKIPRNEYYKYHSRGYNLPGINLEDILSLGNAVPTTELYSERLVHAFVRFKIRDMNGFNTKLENLKNDREHIFLCREYEPVHNPGSKMIIVTTENFDSLLKFVSSLDKYSSDIATSLIFGQDFFRPDLPERLRCKPCRLPVGEKCDACPQYIKPRERTDVRDVDLRITDRIEPCKIAVVQLQMDKLEPLLPWYNGEDKGEIMEKQKGNVIKMLNEAISEKADIIVFPEMSIPEDIVKEIKERIKGYRIIVVAGSHLHHYDDIDSEDGNEKIYYNTCPILISDGKEVKQYDVHKNSKSFEERNIEAKYKDIKIEEGQGMIRFINTGFGDFGVLICYDFLNDEMFNALSKEIDLLIVPSWNRAVDDFIARAVTAKRNRIVVILANNGIYGKSGLFAPYKGERLKDLEQRLAKVNEEKVEKYIIDVLELDRARDRTIWENRALSPVETMIKEKYIRPPATEIVIRHKNHWEEQIEYEITSEDILKFMQEDLISKLAESAKISIDNAEKFVQDCLEWIDRKITSSGLKLTKDAKQALFATVVLAMKKTDEFIKQEIEVYNASNG